jgi:Fe-S cluster assembly ATP-binding protein
MLKITNLHANVDGVEILKGIDLEVKSGEVHAIMGPNGSGKSTLSSILAGKEDYTVTEGEILFQGEDLLDKSIDERACAGLFLGFQYPVEIPGVTTINFLKAALNAKRKYQGKPPFDAMDLLSLVKEKMALLEMDPDFMYRPLNEGFSGGEKKRNEIMQMLLLEPTLSILDEADSGLDIDALQIVSKGVNTLRAADKSIILVTHYQRLLNYIEPDYVHVLIDGQLVITGDKALALKLEEKGYAWLVKGIS